MKKVGILTHPLTENYGGIMQAVALYGYLEGKGYDVVLLRKHKYRPALKNAVIFLLEMIPFQNFRNYRYLYKKRKVQQSFIDKYISRKTQILHTAKELKKAVSDYNLDAIIVGSDQVWKLSSIDDGFFDVYFLSFVSSEKIKKIAYAASFGVDYWQDSSRIEEVKRYLDDFHAISLRESSGVEICENYFGMKNNEHVLDPTMLVNLDFYKRFGLGVIRATPLIVTYFLDADLEKNLLVKEVLKIKGSGFDVIDLVSKKSNHILTVDQWLNEIKNADFVVTDSFHGMVLSIVFKRNFLVVGNAKRGMARFESLLGSLGLLDRLLNDNDFESILEIVSCDINYDDIDDIIAADRMNSANFLDVNLM